MKSNKFLFNGDDFLVSSPDLKNEVQKSLDKCLPGAFVVDSVTVDDNANTVEIKLLWHPNNYYDPQEGCMNLDASVLFTGKLNKSGQQLPMPPHPFSDTMHYSFPLDYFIEEYNAVMKRNNKLKDLIVVSSPTSVTYKFQF